MDFKFSKDAGDSPQQGGSAEKGNQNVLLVVLLILVAGFGYIYFFTSLIKPMQEQKVATPPVMQVVKKPLPSPDGKPAKAGDDVTPLKEDVAAVAKPEPAKATPVVTVPAAKPDVQQVAKVKEEGKKIEVSPSVVKKPLPVSGTAVEKKSAPVEKKPVVAEKQPAAVEKKTAVPEKKQVVIADKKPIIAEKKAMPTKDAAIKVSNAKKPAEKSSLTAEASNQQVKTAVKPVKKESVGSGGVASNNWTVLVGNYLLEEALAADLGRVRSAGVEANVVPGALKKSHMNRLLLAEFTDRASAQAELDKLKRVTSDAFVLDSAGMHMVYAGSYLLDARALSEKERLKAAGFNLTLKRADVSIPTKNLTAGSFTDKKVADDVLKKLRAAGVKATLTH